MALQHPDFDRYVRCRQAGQWPEALALLEGLLAAHPQSAALYWHKAECLEALEREAEVPAALSAVLAKRPDYVPALIKRVEYTGWELDEQAPLPEELEDEDAPPSAAAEAAISARAELEAALWRRSVKDLRTVLRHDAQHHRACFLLSDLLRNTPENLSQEPGAEAEADVLLDKAIALAPDEADYRVLRGRLARGMAFVDDEAAAATPEDVVQTFTGMRYSRSRLEAAVSDFSHVWQTDKSPRLALQLGGVLHDLGRYDEALACYDEALALMPEDDPRRDYLLERRAASSNGGGGEREQMASLLLASLAENGEGNRSQADHMAAQALLGAAEAMRRGASVQDALAANISEDPDTMTAMNIARQIVNVANEPAPGLEAVDAKTYPAYQRRHADAVAKAATKVGLQHIADAEAMAMFNMLGQHVLLRFFRDDSGDVGMASYCLKPKWPGLLAFLLLTLQGKWKVQKMAECVTVFSDGGMITTQPESISPFRYGGKIIVNKRPAKASVADIFQSHKAAVADYLAEHPGAEAMKVHDLAGVEARWVAGQQAKRAYRESVNYVTDEELQRLLGGHYERFADKVRVQIQQITA